MFSNARYLIISILVVLFSINANAQSAKKIVDKYTKRNALGIRNGVANLKMITKDKKGRSKNRDLVLKVYEKGNDKANHIFIKSPANLKGTALLYREDIKSNSSQMHMYLPEFGKTRRIGDGQKKSAFVSSDFTYGDLDGSYFKGAKLKRLKDKTVAGFPCYHIKVTPLKKYTRAKTINLLIRKDSYLADNILFKDKKGETYKEFKLLKWEKEASQWIATQSQMWNKKKGSVTAVAITSIDSKKVLRLNDFTPERIKYE